MKNSLLSQWALRVFFSLNEIRNVWAFCDFCCCCCSFKGYWKVTYQFLFLIEMSQGFQETDTCVNLSLSILLFYQNDKRIQPHFDFFYAFANHILCIYTIRKWNFSFYWDNYLCLPAGNIQQGCKLHLM